MNVMKKIRSYIYFLVGWLFLLGCDSEPNNNGGSSETGIGGSMARFTIKGDYLYTVDQSRLRTFDISLPEKPVYLEGKDQELWTGVETIFSLDTLLLIGTQTGMYIYNVARPDFPQYLSYASHITACDPVVASGNYAYVTLNSGNISCGRATNLLLVFDISDPENPMQIKEMRGFELPRGLGITGNRLFVCDNGLKVFDLTDPESPVWIDDLSSVSAVKNIDTYDIIPIDENLLVIGADGLYQFTYTEKGFTFLSQINVSDNNNP
jgi:hypothetical protein